MKKRWIKKGTSLFLCGLLVATMMVGCGSNDTEAIEETSEVVSDEVTEEIEEVTTDDAVGETSSTFGQVTAIDGNTLTIALFEAGNKQMGEAPSGDTANGEAPEIPDGETPEMPDGELPEGELPDSDAKNGKMPDGGSANISLTGEELTITVNDSTTYIINGSDGALSDLQVNDIITVEMSGDTIVSITVGMNGGPSMNPDTSKNTSTDTE